MYSRLYKHGTREMEMNRLGLSESAIYAYSKLTESQHLEIKKRLLCRIRIMSLESGNELYAGHLEMEIREVEMMIEANR